MRTSTAGSGAGLPATKPVFIHISKNAGTSIIATAGDAITVAGHRIAESWVAENGRNALLFAVVRNPFDRVLSEYHFRLRRFEDGEVNQHLANLVKPFDAWVRSTFSDGELRTRAHFEATGVSFSELNMIDDCLIWFLPQTRWIGLSGGETLVDEILRYESLEDDWHRFSQEHGIDRRLVHRNQSRRDRDYRPYYTRQSWEIVRDYYREDFEAFGFE
ncbi:MAG: sulfotransferase family protein [Actinomycetia bacterium]|nr:sulfotransferase family protein [Actinomycetes bacterium]